jgi:hypothetical protein
MNNSPPTSSPAQVSEASESGTDFIFRAKNRHVAECGTPPCIDEPPPSSNDFRSYFENEFGEQWMVTYDGATDAISVCSGDCGWQTELTFRSFEESLASLPTDYASRFSKVSADGRKTPTVCGKDGPVTLGKAEQMWIAACLEVVEAHRAAARLLAKHN